MSLSQCESESDSLGVLLDHYMSVYSEVEERFSFWKPYMVKDHYKAVVDFIVGTVVFGYRSAPGFMIIVSPWTIHSMAFSDLVKGYLPDLHIITSRQPVSDQSYVYIHYKKLETECSEEYSKGVVFSDVSF